MKIDAVLRKMINTIFSRSQFFLFQFSRIIIFRILSNCRHIIGSPHYRQPALLQGKGTIVFGNNVCIAVLLSPGLYSGYTYINAKNRKSTISIGDNVCINNNCFICSEGEGIEIGSDTLIGFDCEIIDTDFHDLDPDRRSTGAPRTSKVIIGKNVFIGNHVRILKGVIIGDNAIVGNSTVVTRSVPDNTIVAGNPARIIRKI